MIRIRDLSYTYPTGVTALRDVNVELPRAHILAILGESGSGKTTLLKCIGRFLPVQEGCILFHDRDITKIPEIEFRRSIGIVFQSLYLFPHLTVLENMTLAPRKVLKKDPEESRDGAIRMLAKLGIESLSDTYPSQISGGQAQRVAIARSLLLRPEYLLLDEPTSALDVQTTEDFGRWLLSLKEETTFVVVTHDVLFTSRVATSGVLIDQGSVIAQGNIKDILGEVGYDAGSAEKSS
jgi:ABC-type polar amino acid transport system ATPase subunit